MRRAQQGVRERERTKSLTVAVACHGRRLARAAGARLAADGLLLAAEAMSSCSNGPSSCGPCARARSRRARRSSGGGGGSSNEGSLEAPREVSLRGRAGSRAHPASPRPAVR